MTGVLIPVLRAILAVIAISLCVVKLKHNDKQVALYWAFAGLYWIVAFIEHMAI